MLSTPTRNNILEALTLDKIRKWVEDLPIDTAGTACTSMSCPIAEYLMSRFNTIATVSCTEAMVGDLRVSLPLEIQEVIHHVDHPHIGQRHNQLERVVTKQRMIEVLTQVEETFREDEDINEEEGKS